MKILPRYSIDSASQSLGIDKVVLLEHIKKGELSLAVELTAFNYGFFNLSKEKPIDSSDWIHDFEDVLDEDNIAYAYIVLGGIQRYENFRNPRFVIADKASIRQIDYFTKYPAGYDAEFYEQLFRVNAIPNLLVGAEKFDEIHSFDVYITREALRHSPLTSYLFSLKDWPELTGRQIPIAEQLISGLKRYLGDQTPSSPVGHLNVIHNLLIKIYKTEENIPKAPTLLKLVEKQGVEMTEKTLRTLLSLLIEK